ALEARLVAVRVVLGLEGHVARIERQQCRPRGQGQRLVLDRAVPIAREPRIPDLAQRPATQRVAVAVLVRETISDLLEPGVDDLRARSGGQLLEGQKSHVGTVTQKRRRGNGPISICDAPGCMRARATAAATMAPRRDLRWRSPARRGPLSSRR